MEDELNRVKQKIQTIEKELADPDIYADKEKFLLLEKDYKSAIDLSANLEKDYEEIFLKMIELEEKSL